VATINDPAKRNHLPGPVLILLGSLLAAPVASAAEFVRGDVEGAGGKIELTDSLVIFSHLFLASPPLLTCPAAADANDSGKVDISDGIYLLDFLFLDGPEPPAPFPLCGNDPTPDRLGLCVYSAYCQPPPPPVTNSLGMQLVYLPPGTFLMGSAETEPGRERYGRDETLHGVTISRGFYLGAMEVTQGQYVAIMEKNPTAPEWQDSARPVSSLTWCDATEFCRRLSEREGRAYRLPTEAEWEYACRAGSTTAFWFGEASACGLTGCEPPHAF